MEGNHGTALEGDDFITQKWQLGTTTSGEGLLWAQHLHLEGQPRVKVPALLQALSGQGWSHLPGLGRCSLVSKPMIIQKRNSNRLLLDVAFIAKHSLMTHAHLQITYLHLNLTPEARS